MQVKQTFLKSYKTDKERKEAIKKIYRQLYIKFQYDSLEIENTNKTNKKTL